MRSARNYFAHGKLLDPTHGDTGLQQCAYVEFSLSDDANQTHGEKQFTFESIFR